MCHKGYEGNITKYVSRFDYVGSGYYILDNNKDVWENDIELVEESVSYVL
jgi:hypothetical protein